MAGTYWLTILPETSRLEAGIRDAVERIAKTTKIEPKIEPTGATQAGQKAGREVQAEIEKSVKKTKVEPQVKPKVDEGAARDAGKKTGDAINKGIDQADVGGRITKGMQDVGRQVGGGIGTGIAQGIPTGMGGVAGKISDVLRATLPKAGEAAGVAMGTAIGIKISEGIEKNFDEAVGRGAATVDAMISRGSAKFDELINKLRSAKAPTTQMGSAPDAGGAVADSTANSVGANSGKFDRAGAAIMGALKNAVAKAAPAVGAGVAIGAAVIDGVKEKVTSVGSVVSNAIQAGGAKISTATDVGIFLGDKISGGLQKASDKISSGAGLVTSTIGNISTGITGLKDQLGGDDSWAAPGLDALNGALDMATPLVDGLNTASALAAGGADLLSVATKTAAGVQWLFNNALKANPIGLVVTAIGALVAGLVWFFTKTELGQQIWQKFTEYLGVAWDFIKNAFSVAWDAISGIWDSMVAGAQAVWDGIKSKFDGVVDFVKGLPGRVGAAAKGLWDGIGNAFKTMIDKLKGWWNSFARSLSFTVPTWVPDALGGGQTFSLPTFDGYAVGGYTGNGSTSRIAGVVHGGEYVIKAASTNGIQNAFPGLLNYMNNNGKLPGYEGGGSVSGDGNFNPGMKIDLSHVKGYESGIKQILDSFFPSWDYFSKSRRGNRGAKLLRKFFPSYREIPKNFTLPDVANVPGQNLWMTGGSFATGGLVPGYMGGGLVQLGDISGPGITTDEQQSMWDAIRSAFPDAVLNSATRTEMTEGHPDYHNAGRAIDISGPSMGPMASWIASNYPNSLELIHSPFGHNIKDGQDVGDGNKTYGPDLMKKHGNHVHWALGGKANVNVGAEASVRGTSSTASSSLGSSSGGGSSSPGGGASSGRSSGGSSGGKQTAGQAIGKKAQEDGANAGKEFGQMMVSGLLEEIGLDGSLFSNPLEWPSVKSLMAGINWAGGLLSIAGTGNKPGEPGAAGATDAAAAGGGTFGGGMAAGAADAVGLGGLLSAIPSATEMATRSGSPALAPGEFNPAVAGGTAVGTTAGMSTFAPPAPHQGGGQPPGPVDNSININGPVGMDPAAVQTKLRSEQNARTRTTVRQSP